MRTRLIVVPLLVAATSAPPSASAHLDVASMVVEGRGIVAKMVRPVSLRIDRFGTFVAAGFVEGMTIGGTTARDAARMGLAPDVARVAN